MIEKEGGNAAAIPDITKAYCTVVENYTRLAMDEVGKYKTEWLQREAATLREMIWTLACGDWGQMYASVNSLNVDKERKVE
jgi:hypothetical protein